MLAEILFIVVPVALIIFCVVCASRYSEAKRANKETPGTYSEDELKTRKVLMIIAVVLAGLMLAAVGVLAVMLFFAIAFM